MSDQVVFEFFGMCNGIPSGKTVQYVNVHKDGSTRFSLPPVVDGIWSNAAYTFDVWLRGVQYIDDGAWGKTVVGRSMMLDCNGCVVGRGMWSAYAGSKWTPGVPVGIVHYPERVTMDHDAHGMKAGTPLAFSLITMQAEQ